MPGKQAIPATLPSTLPDTLECNSQDISDGSGGEQWFYELQNIVDHGESFRFTTSAVHIGRDPKTCAIQIPEGSGVSRMHCALFTVGGDVFVHDLSTNGTFVNGKVVRKGNRVMLRSGDVLSVMNPTLPESPKYSFRFTILRKNEDGIFIPVADGFNSTGDSERDWWHEMRVDGSPVELREVIGSGNFATVRRGIVHDGRDHEVAVKIIDKKRGCASRNGDFDFSSLHSEVEILRSMQHPNIIRIYDGYDGTNHFALVLELVKYGDLLDYISGRGASPFTESEVRGLFVQLLGALIYMHSKRVVHRDLKPENILIDVDEKAIADLKSKGMAGDGNSFGAGGTGVHDVDRLARLQVEVYQKNAPLIPPSAVTLKITDFGLAKYCSEKEVMMSMCGTPNYLAPEVLNMDQLSDDAAQRQGYSPKVDVWSLGIIFYILCCGMSPKNAQKGNLTFSTHMANFSDTCKDLIQCMLQVDPQKRASLADICSHEWLRDIHVDGSESFLKVDDELDMSATVVVHPDLAASSPARTSRDASLEDENAEKLPVAVEDGTSDIVSAPQTRKRKRSVSAGEVS